MKDASKLLGLHITHLKCGTISDTKKREIAKLIAVSIFLKMNRISSTYINLD